MTRLEFTLITRERGRLAIYTKDDTIRGRLIGCHEENFEIESKDGVIHTIDYLDVTGLTIL